MEQRPHNSDDDRDRNIPEPERFYAGEVDLTGAARQDDVLADVIGDAIVESENGEFPEWGARSLARALANERDDPLSGALHHFAVTGRADTAAIGRELAELYEGTVDEQIKTWAGWLSVYIANLPDTEGETGEPANPSPNLQMDGHQQTTELDIRSATKLERRFGQAGPSPSPDEPAPGSGPSDRGPAGRLTDSMHQAAAEAAARGETIGLEHVQAIAAMLSGFLVVMGVEDSAMMRLAEFGDVDQLKLYDECQQLKSVVWKIPDVPMWVDQLERYIEQQTTAGNPQVSQGLREHGHAFRAFLHVPGVQQHGENLLGRFNDAYSGSFASMHELLDELTDVTKGIAAIVEAARTWGLEEFVTIHHGALAEVAHSTWNIVEYQGRLHVFAR